LGYAALGPARFFDCPPLGARHEEDVGICELAERQPRHRGPKPRRDEHREPTGGTGGSQRRSDSIGMLDLETGVQK
jgi:hypothetical protein